MYIGNTWILTGHIYFQILSDGLAASDTLWPLRHQTTGDFLFQGELVCLSKMGQGGRGGDDLTDVCLWTDSNNGTQGSTGSQKLYLRRDEVRKGLTA